MLLLHIAQLLCSSVSDELCASCFEKPNAQSGDEHERRVIIMEQNGTERNGAERKERTRMKMIDSGLSVFCTVKL